MAHIKQTRVSFLSMLAILFIALKLTGCVTWSWWWVLAPIWIPLGIALGLFAFAGICMAIAVVLDNKG